jgi:uncharacterized membrane protein SirB2
MGYALLKYLHVGTVVVTFVLFATRGTGMLIDSPRLHGKWIRVLPHINDTILLMSGIGLAALLGQYPFVNGWLTAKVLALVAYILLGTIALKRGKTKAVRATAFILALATFGYLVAVALTHNPLPFLH